MSVDINHDSNGLREKDGEMSRFISFSLYVRGGSGRKYLIGAERNVELAKQFYPDWKCVFWCDKSVPETSIQSLTKAGAIVIKQPAPVYPPMFWRFLIADVGVMTPFVSRYLVRDADSRIGQREADACNQWIESRRPFWTARDHPAHARPINGGMWGAVAGCIPKMTALMDMFPHKDEYHSDSEFLDKILWPLVKDKAFQHDSFSSKAYPGSFPFPTKRKDQKDFVGQVFEVDEHGNESPREGDWQQIPKDT